MLNFEGKNGGGNSMSSSQMVTVTVLVFLWYAFAVVAITTSKMLLNRVALPNILCSVQFIFAGVISYVYLQYTKGFHRINPNIRSLVAQTSLGYTFGFILTTSAFSLGTCNKGSKRGKDSFS